VVDVPRSTLAGIETRAEGRWAIWSRRGFLVLLLAFVLAGLSGLLGVRTTTAESSAGGYDLSFRYATSARAGLDVPWEVTLVHAGGFGHDVRLAVTGDYFDVFETQGFTPEPSDATRDADTLYLTFAAPPGDTLRVSYDAYIQPSSQLGRDGTLSVLEDGSPVASVDFSTRLLP
jgi:hypothetical protein